MDDKAELIAVQKKLREALEREERRRESDRAIMRLQRQVDLANSSLHLLERIRRLLR